MVSERVSPFSAARASTASITSVGSLIPTMGSVPVGGLPIRFPVGAVVDLRILFV